MDLAAGLNHASRVVDEQPRGTEGSSVSDLWRREAKELETASLWWVAPDMTTLAADTGLCGGELPHWDRDAETRSGLLVWDGGLPIRVVNRSADRDERTVTIDAVSWAPIPEWSQDADMDGVRIELWTRQAIAGRPPSPLSLITVRFSDGRDDTVRVGDHSIAPELAIWRILCATMLLSQQPQVGSTRPANFREDGSAKETRTRPVPAVTVIDLRTVREWTVGPDGKAASDGRDYTHRWIVRGHMRTYHTGPRGAKTEKRWIAPYVAGPEGAPLVPKEHVWVWRR
ncbi:hypothetical protein GCM10027169_13320 [Gordonia jinhuaensis]|uniref:Uncharacterized protein n=2 Tax=Gordonia jinhuaensis TaxID=1517702 RepID=A0A916WRD6_9ACTN|nr:hypothetical protein GCM10011489_08660 [Gordonia jinhuaensis]